MSRYLFTVDAHKTRDSRVALLPGIPQSLLQDETVGNLAQGAGLLLVSPDGRAIHTTLETYFMSLPDEGEFDPTQIPVVPVLPPDVSAAMIPIGTKVYIE